MSEIKVRLNRSQDYSTVHGERAPGDRHASVHFYQHGLPFDAEEIAIPDHPDVTGNPKLQETYAKLLAKAKKRAERKGAAAPAGEPEPKVTDQVDGDDDDNEPVDLDAWLRGEQDVTWNDVSQAIALRYKKRVNNKADAVEFLLKEGVCSKEQLSPQHKKLIG